MSIAIEVRPDGVPPNRTIVESAPQLASPRGVAGVWRRRGVLAFGLLGIVAAGTLALSQLAAENDGRQLLAHAVTRGDLVVSVVEQGTLESSSNREIKCRIKGGSTVLWVIETGTQVQPGDELVRLDTSKIEDEISLQKIAYEKALGSLRVSEGEVAFATISVTEYLEGTFRSLKATKEKELVVAQSQLKAAQNLLEYFHRMYRKGFASALEVSSHEDSVRHAELDVNVKQTELDSLERFTRPKTVQELESKLKTAQAHFSADTAAVALEKARLERAEQQLANGVIRADVAGLVMYPSVAEWMNEPDIKEGATVHEDQILLMMPDLQQMQVKVGVHESKVDRVTRGMPARMKLKDKEIDGEVISIASMTRPTGWWNGNMVKYDTVIRLKDQAGLKPGMTAAVEIFLARFHDVLRVPVAAVVEQDGEFWCWVESGQEPVKRSLKLGDTNDQFIVVESGLSAGDRVVLNPLDLLDEAQRAALQPSDDEAAADDAESTTAAATAPSAG
jgi:HlyD family secretion protein